MNKSDLVKKISLHAEVSKATASQMVESLISEISTALQRGDRVKLAGFGSFHTYQRRPKNGRNPKSGEPITIASLRVVKFSPAPDLKTAVSQPSTLEGKASAIQEVVIANDEEIYVNC